MQSATFEFRSLCLMTTRDNCVTIANFRARLLGDFVVREFLS